MIERYTLPEMAEVWSKEHFFRKLLEIEITVVEVMADLGKIPQEAARKIREKASFSTARVDELEQRTHHDLLAFLEVVNESLGEESRYIHMGMTSSDVKDTAQALLLKEAAEKIINEIESLRKVVYCKAIEHKNTIMIGRTHGVHAEPITFGFKLAVWYEELNRQIKRMQQAIEEVAVGKCSGAVGTYTNIDPQIESMVCERLHLKPAFVSTQIIQRDCYAVYISVLTNIAGTLEKMATEYRNLQRTEILEVEEFFEEGQKGSSAMPHKKNPISSEQISGLARIVRSYSIVAFENISLWHERDISHSSAERIILPDSTILVFYMLQQMTRITRTLLVHKENMQCNLERTCGLIFSQKVLLALVNKGLLREEAYQLVQRNALRAWEEHLSLKDLLLQDQHVLSYLSSQEIDEIFNYKDFLSNIDFIFSRLGLV